MIVFDLQCGKGHAFEGWFDDANDFDGQRDRGLIQCPFCGTNEVVRVPSTFGIRSQSPASPGQDGPDAGRALVRAMSQYVEQNFDNVGPKFATEALKIHYGVSEPRSIRGVSTKDEEKMLEKEGVHFAKVPMLASRDDTDA
ncbi:MAG: DUF1178 family protein [Proteobacteria bacterium]|nr:DUF1178 family protein [Pseudomonadota bacterium]